jgi:hypothetical protein
MNKQQALERLSAIEAEAKELREIINAPEKKPSPHEFLTKWLNENRLKLRGELGEDRIIWYRGDQWIFDIDFKNKRFRCYYYTFWNKLETEYLLSYKLKTFNCEGFTPWYLPVHHRLQLLKTFNCEGFTPKSTMLYKNATLLKPFNKP